MRTKDPEGPPRNRDAEREKLVVCECYLHGIEHKPPPFLNQTRHFPPTRFVSPATNKQQNERGPISRRQRLLEKRARFLIPCRLSTEIYLLRAPYLARPDTLYY